MSRTFRESTWVNDKEYNSDPKFYRRRYSNPKSRKLMAYDGHSHTYGYRDEAIEGVLVGWGDASKSYKTIAKRQARHQQKQMIRGLLEDMYEDEAMDIYDELDEFYDDWYSDCGDYDIYDEDIWYFWDNPGDSNVSIMRSYYPDGLSLEEAFARKG